MGQKPAVSNIIRNWEREVSLLGGDEALNRRDIP